MLDIRGMNQNPNSDLEEDRVENNIPRPQPKLQVPSVEPETNYLEVFSVIAAIIVIVVAALLYILKMTKASALKTKDSQSNELQQSLANPALKNIDDQIQSYQTGLDIYQSVISSKIYWSKMFQGLANTDPKNVKFNTFTLDENKNIKISGETNTYSNLAKLVRSLENSKSFSEVKLTSSTTTETLGVSKVNFAISVKVNSSSFINSNISEGVSGQNQ